MVVMTLPTNIARLRKGVTVPRRLAFVGTATGGGGFSPRRPQFR